MTDRLEWSPDRQLILPGTERWGSAQLTPYDVLLVKYGPMGVIERVEHIIPPPIGLLDDAGSRAFIDALLARTS